MSDKKNIVLGVTGSIAAHKAVDMCSLLTKEGADVHVVMTKDAQQFITPLPFKTLSKNPVVMSLYDDEEGWRPTHIRLADTADLLLIAPATANTIAKLAGGLADDALGCIALALSLDAGLIIAAYGNVASNLANIYFAWSHSGYHGDDPLNPTRFFSHHQRIGI